MTTLSPESRKKQTSRKSRLKTKLVGYSFLIVFYLFPVVLNKQTLTAFSAESWTPGQMVLHSHTSANFTNFSASNFFLYDYLSNNGNYGRSKSLILTVFRKWFFIHFPLLDNYTILLSLLEGNFEKLSKNQKRAFLYQKVNNKKSWPIG